MKRVGSLEIFSYHGEQKLNGFYSVFQTNDEGIPSKSNEDSDDLETGQTENSGENDTVPHDESEESIRVNCRKCDKSYKNKRSLREHEKKHLDQKFECDKCGKIFDNLKSWKSHQMTHGEKMSCDVCNQVYKNKLTLRTHMKMHVGSAPFLCSNCGREFFIQSSYTFHQKRCCKMDKPFQCRSCDYRTYEECKLKYHETVHTGEKPFVCEFCAMRFRMKSTLVRHRNIHTNERMFKCEYCEKVFNKLENLKQHKRLHTGEKPYTCSFCGQKFTHYLYHKNHLKKHHSHTGEKSEVPKT